jgi:hypothetical protein
MGGAACRRRTRGASRWLRGLIGALIVLVPAGCGLFGVDGPEEARLRLEGTAGKEVRLITSTLFAAQRQSIIDPETGLTLGDTILVQPLLSDTLAVTLPFEAVYDIRRNEQFFANIVRLDPNGDALYARLWIDGDVRSERRPNAGQDSVVIIYNYRDSKVDPDPDEF